MSKLFAVILVLSLLFNRNINASDESSKVFHYYATTADSNHFPLLMELIGSIHKVDFDSLDEIAVFDLGLTANQIDIIKNIEKANLYQIEKVHPDLFKYFKTHPSGRLVRGWYAWKPVILKQALDMFPYFLYMDAGTLVLKSPNNLFKHIKQNGYFLIGSHHHSIEERVTSPVIEKIILKFPKKLQEKVLKKDAYITGAGIQGISQKLYKNYILPVYKLAGDLSVFADDGSAKLGFGAGRHDLILFSIYSFVENLNLNYHGWTNLIIDGKEIPFHILWDPKQLNDQTCIYHSRWDYKFGGDKTKFIRWKLPLLHTDKSSMES